MGPPAEPTKPSRISRYPSKPLVPTGTVNETSPVSSVTDELMGLMQSRSLRWHALTEAPTYGSSVSISAMVAENVMSSSMLGLGHKGASRHDQSRPGRHASPQAFCVQARHAA